MVQTKKKFLDHVLNALHLDVEQLSANERKELSEVSRNALFDLEGPRSISRTPLPKELWYQDRLFMPCVAIYKSHEALLDVEIYVRRYPYCGTRVSPTSHLRHSIELYLQEAYVLRQRMIDFLNSLEKDYAGCPQAEELEIVNQPLCVMLKDYLKPIMAARKDHVHGGGFDDEHLKRIDILELLAGHMSPNKTDKQRFSKEAFGLLYKSGYKKERKRWTKLVHDWNSAIGKLLDRYFEILDGIVFDQAGELVYPKAAETFSRKMP